MLDAGCVAHNYTWFTEVAIDDALARQEWDYAEHCARRLEAYTEDQPLPWTDFIIRRARTLVAWHRDGPGADLRATLEGLAEEARAADLNSALHDIEAVFKASGYLIAPKLRQVPAQTPQLLQAVGDVGVRCPGDQFHHRQAVITDLAQGRR